jgi:hypothetical protein
LWIGTGFSALALSARNPLQSTSSTTTTTARKSETQKKLASRFKELRKTSMDVCPLTPQRVCN